MARCFCCGNKKADKKLVNYKRSLAKWSGNAAVFLFFGLAARIGIAQELLMHRWFPYVAGVLEILGVVSTIVLMGFVFSRLIFKKPPFTEGRGE